MKSQRICMGKGDRDIGERPEPVVDMRNREAVKYYGHQTKKQGATKASIEGRVEGTRGRD